MRITFLGHAAFLITTAGGTKIVTDPYEPGGFGGAIGYGPLREPADIVVISHDHADHNFIGMVPGNPLVLNALGEETHRGVTFRSLATYHDPSHGAERGDNIVRVIQADGITLCHLGDLGEQVSAEDAACLGPIDVLMVPVGGRFTVDGTGATAIVNRLRPRIAIPMHFKTDKVGFDLATVDEFLTGKKRVRRVNGSELEITSESLPEPTEIVVLEPAL